MAKKRKTTKRPAQDDKAFREYWEAIFATLDRMPSVAARYDTMTDKDGMTLRVRVPDRFRVR